MLVLSKSTSRHRPGWLGIDLDKEAIAFAFTADHLAAIDELMKAVRARKLSLQDIERRHFSHPALDPFLAAIVDALKQGHGLVVMRGFPVDKYGVEEMKLMYWGIGTHFGRGVSQSSAGDMLGLVTDRKSSRGYTSSRALALHCDPTEISALLCIRSAKEGGRNTFASSLKIHEIIEREHPEYLPILERGFPYHRRGEEKPGAEPVTPYNVPVYSVEGGILSCRYSREMFEPAVRELGRSLTPLERAAIDFFDEVALRDALRFELHLEAGEAVFMNNFEVLHARTSFVDWEDPEQKRLLFRLWLEGEPLRPLRPEVLVHKNNSGRQGIDRQEGKVPGLPQYDPTIH